jgi:hypothetical protein
MPVLLAKTVLLLNALQLLMMPVGTLMYSEPNSLLLIIFTVVLLNYRSRDSAVGIATGYGLHDQGVRV